MANENAHLSVFNKEVDLPIYHSTLGEPVIDVSSLSKQGIFTFDPGFLSTASCESKITYIDGNKGVLLYRGYPIEQLAEKTDFLEVCYLLLNGELPNNTQKRSFYNDITSQMIVDTHIADCIRSFKPEAHPMAMLISLTGAVAGYYHETINSKSEAARTEAAHLIIAKIVTLAAMCYRHSQGKPFMAPRADLTYAENFLHMMFADKADAKPNPILARALDHIFTLHADHEQNASTSTVRLAGSTGTDPFAAIAAGIAALWGPAHGGANEAALAMLREIGCESRIEEYILKAKDKSDPFRLMGFGHRVYKNYDPRAKVMRETCHEVLNELGCHNDPTLKVALRLEKIALEDPYFIERKLYPNIDFYSGITLNAMGLPANMFTVIFALARTSGWIAHWKEMLNDPDNKIGRPRQRYTGYMQRDVPTIDKR